MRQGGAPGAARGPALGLALLLAACAGPPPPPVATPAASDAPPALTYRAVLVAGSDDTQAFDNGTARMREILVRSGLAREADVTRFSAIAGTPGAERADAVPVLQHIATLSPADGQACLVFITSHGLPRRGLAMMASRQMIGARIMDRALSEGCGDRPTLAILSGCFSGVFAREPMTRPNRVILTAARDDRPSFGCGARDEFTYFDACLFDSLAAGRTWQAVFDATTACVSRREQERNFDASYPQAWFGSAAAALPVPVEPPRSASHTGS